LSFELVLKKTGSISFLYSPKLFFEAKVLVVFTTRQGGVSPPPFNSLNLGFHVGDSKKNVVENRQLLFSNLDLDINQLTTAEQVHGNLPAIIDENFVGRGAKAYEDSILGADALVSALDNVSLSLFFADCVPIILVEPIKRYVTVIHAGWRGILGDIILKTISMLNNNFNARSHNLLAFIGPSIGECCYEVDESLMEKFRKKFDLSISGKRLDLSKFAERQLREEGILPEKIIGANLCTSCHNDMFFSFRKAQTTGRQAGLVALMG
jgi:YfiH family protein